MKRQRMIKALGHTILYALIFVVSLLFFSVIWAKNNYGNIGMEEILFHLNMPLQGTSESFIFSYLRTALAPAAALTVSLIVWTVWPSTYVYRLQIRCGLKSAQLQFFPLRLRPGWVVPFLASGLAATCFLANQSFDLVKFIGNQLHRSPFIGEEYVSPEEVRIVFPEKKRNLITIYVESAETSAQDRANGGLRDQNVIPEMTQLALDNVSFSQSDLLEGAAVAPACGWTIAGLVAETAGIPLKLYGYSDKTIDNSMTNYEYFLPGVISLGDILAANGYRTFFMAGSDFVFGGRESYFTQHGDYRIWDYKTAKAVGKIPQDYKVWWGFEDKKLYKYAKEQLLELAKSGEPFHFAMLTVDTHHQNGYLCGLCPDTYGDRYSNVWACASAQLDHFIRWLKKQDFYENTTIVITGDHCSMDSDFYGEYTYDKHNGELVRKVYNAFLNAPVAPVQEKNRKFTTMDFFPTTLASLGVSIEGDRLGLGTNLFSGRETLAEEFGYEYLFAELEKKSVFYNEKLLYP